MSKPEKLNIRFVGVEITPDPDTFFDLLNAHIVVNGDQRMYAAQHVYHGEKIFQLNAKAIMEIKRVMKRQRWMATRRKS